MLHKLAKFHHLGHVYFPSYSVKCVSCLGIWWRHDIWISEKLKSDYLKNEKSFWSEIKNIFSYLRSALF